MLIGKGCPLRSRLNGKQEILVFLQERSTEVPFRSSGRHIGSPACPTSYWGAHPGPDRELQGERRTAREHWSVRFPQQERGQLEGVQEMSSPQPSKVYGQSADLEEVSACLFRNDFRAAQGPTRHWVSKDGRTWVAGVPESWQKKKKRINPACRGSAAPRESPQKGDRLTRNP